jgi:eukaryotic-like serine/threonine-protein kinase
VPAEDAIDCLVVVGAETLSTATRLLAGRYELETLIGKGGVGEVWRARHVALNSRVAIKFLQLASAQKESAQRRFTMEAQLTAQLKTPHAVQVFDFGVTEEGQPYLVMELLEGETLGRRLERVKRLSVKEASRLLGQAARALHRAHALGIVHRDFKPDNIVITEDDVGRDQVKVLDFGVAKLLGALEEGMEEDQARSPGEATSFTGTGAVLGTPLYMAPEQVRDPAGVDLRADIWAFGVVAFECLTGRAPFTGGSLAELFERIQLGHHPNANFLEPGVPPGFDLWFDIACAPDPLKRFTNASIAWKHLTVALDVGVQDGSGSFPGFDHNESSGERRVVVAPGQERTDSSAPTLESERPGELLARTHDDEFHTLRRIPRAAITSKGKSLPPPAGAAVPAPPMAAPRQTKRGLWLVGAIVVAAAGAGGVVWRTALRPVDSVAPAAAAPMMLAPMRTSVPTESAPAPALAAPPTSVVAASAAPVAASAPSTSPSASHGPARTVASARRASSVTAPTSVSATEAVVAAPSPVVTDARSATPPPATAPPADPGSYR